MVDLGCYLNLPNEEWACRVMINIIANTGFEEVDETSKNSLIEALNLYQ